MKKAEIKITGMMCQHCEAHAKKALEGIGLTVDSVSHENKNAIVTYNGELDRELVIRVIKDAGYTVDGISEK